MKLEAVFVGKPTVVENKGKEVTTGIFKQEVSGPIKVGTLNLEGDQQADLTVHGGVNKAVYVYDQTHYNFWKDARPDLSFVPGQFGENLSVTGVPAEEELTIGDQFRLGSALFQVTQPRLPCFKLGIKMGDPGFLKDFMKAMRPGFYVKVLEEGTITPGDEGERVKNNPGGLTVNDVVRLYTSHRTDKELLTKAVGTTDLPEDWIEYFQEMLEKL
ncbi:MAG TPA: MOSC domain-containing protein [Cytophagales bacterium]|nr:MOSC domain-containing protein [Cytophagales bacterium]HAA19252.1 MOSC domain-containing protein [Cytophagales bacterium]HAP62519.1 MOSC domain-containing protein [Cytophagales bacterium]